MPEANVSKDPISWTEAAELLAGGVPVHDVAKLLHVNRKTVWRHLGSSRGFRAAIAEEQHRRVQASAAYIDGLREDVATSLSRLVGLGNARATLWLARELNVVDRLAARFEMDETLEPVPANVPAENSVPPTANSEEFRAAAE